MKRIAILLAGVMLFASGGAVTPASALSLTAIPTPGSGYWMLGADGAVYPFGTAGNCGRMFFHQSAGDRAFGADVVPRADGNGYWVLNGTDEVDEFACLNRVRLDPTQPVHTNNFANLLHPGEVPISMSTRPDGTGYWVFTNVGRALAFGTASWYGDMSGVKLNGPVVDSVATASGHGYYMVASDGGIFTFGDAHFHGSTGALSLTKPIVSMAPSPDGRGYWLIASDGGVFSFNVPFYGSMAARPLNKPVVGIIASATGRGYLLVASDGGIFTFGDAAFHGSLGNKPPTSPITAVAVTPRIVTLPVTYAVTGTGTAEVKWESNTGAEGAGVDLSDSADVTLPWTRTITWPPPDYAGLSARLDGSGTISCTISRQGIAIARAHSSGPHASCNLRG